MKHSAWIVLVFPALVYAEAVRIPVLSVEKNHRARPGILAQAPAGSPHRWSVELKTLHGGKQEGVDLLIVDNGKIQVTLIPTRGMGIQNAKLGDFVLGWHSPVKEIVHPKHVNLQARSGLGWLDGFTEMMCRCGLENNGQPGQDRFITNTGVEATMDLTLHGKIANLPSQEVNVLLGSEPSEMITIRAVVHERMLFGPKLELATEFTTRVNSTTFSLKDVVTNRGSQPEEFQMLYHINLGRPLLEAGAHFLTPAAKVTPFNANAARDIKTWNEYLDPTPGYVEQVYLIQPKADADGRTLALLRNATGNRGASVRFATKELPYLTLWKNTGAEADGYVTGIEPGTNYPNKRAVERAQGRVPKLEAGASHAMTLEFGLHGPEGVRTLQTEVERLQGGRAPEIGTIIPAKK